MFTRLRVQDFQSIAGADLELAPFTVIVGDNRSGKTALLRALRALITNKTGSGFIRRGKARCVVTLDTLEGHSITWQKDKTTASYEMDGRSFSKLAGSVPDEIKQVLGVQEVVVDSTLTLMPQMAKDTELLFLLDKPPGQAARALAKLTRLDVVVKAQILCKQFIRSLKDELKGVEKNIFRAEDELEEFAGIEEKIDRNLVWTKDYESIAERLNRLSLMNTHMQHLTEAIGGLSLPVVFNTLLPVDLDSLHEAVKLHKQLSNTVAPGDPPEDISYVPVTFGELEEAVELELHLYCAVGNLEEDTKDVENLNDECTRLSEQLEGLQGTVCPICGGTIA